MHVPATGISKEAKLMANNWERQRSKINGLGSCMPFIFGSASSETKNTFEKGVLDNVI
jgi:hypothetical protein